MQQTDREREREKEVMPSFFSLKTHTHTHTQEREREREERRERSEDVKSWAAACVGRYCHGRCGNYKLGILAEPAGIPHIAGHCHGITEGTHSQLLLAFFEQSK